MRNRVAGAWSAAGRVLLFLMSCAAVLIVAGSLGKSVGLWAAALVGTVASVATLLLTWIFVRWDGLRLGDVGAAPGRGSGVRFVAGFGLGLMLVAVRTLLTGTGGHVVWVRTGPLAAGPLMVMLLGYVALACREELAFRGYTLRRLESAFGGWVALLVVGIAFALEHRAGGYSWTNALLGAFAGSLLFGMAALATRGLAVPIGLHAAWNFGDWLTGGKDAVGIWRLVIKPGYEGHVAHVAMASYLVVFGLATIGFWWRAQHITTI